MCQASPESLGQSVKNSYPVFGHGTRDKEQKGSPTKEGRGGSLVPYWSSDNDLNHFLLRLPIKGHALCEQRKLRCFHKPVWLFDFAEENCPSKGTGKNKFNKYCRHLWFFMFLLVRILVLKRTDWDIRPAGSGIYEKGTFTGRDLTPGSYPFLCFNPPSLRSPATHWCCMSVWHVWEIVTRSRPRRRKTIRKT